MFLGVTGALCASAPRSASAQDANGFGEKGQLILSADRLMPILSFSSQSVTTARPNGTTNKVTDSGTSAAFLFGREPNLGVVHTLPRIAFDFTIIRHLTLGGSFAVGLGLGGKREVEPGDGTSTKFDSPNTTVIGFAPRVGYIIPLGHVFAFWPRAGFAVYSVSSTTDTLRNNIVEKDTDRDTVFSLDLDPQFAWTPIQHFFIHFGPLVNIPLAGSRSSENERGPMSVTTKSDLNVFHFGLSAGLGGWFDL